jgi:hypothetical protein
MKSRLLAVRVWCLLLLVSLGTSLSSFGVEAPPEVKAFVINGGDPQRSMVTSIAITFSADVGASLQVDDLRLTNLTNNAAVSGAQFIYKATTKTGTWTFPAQMGKSLPDGNYLAVIRPADVVGPSGLQLVPNANATTWSTKFHRYFGDFDGDRDVDFLDTAKMRKTDLTAPPNKNYNPAADFNGDGKVDDTDLDAFKVRYLTVLSGQTFAPTVMGAPVRTNQQTITLSGTAAPNTHVVITNGFFTFEGQADDTGKFSITVSLLANRINSLFVVGDGFAATDFSALTPVTITQDSTPPFLYVDSPSDQSTVDTDKVTVTGRVGDLLSGFEGLTVKVNQVDANISAGIGPNGTFEARDIPLAMGENFLAVIATDSLGSSITKSVMITRVAQLQMEVVSGNDQTAIRNTELPAALVVRVRDTKGQPFANKIVNFQVTRSDGHTSPTQGQTDLAGPMMAQVRTDAQGVASAYWRLGSDSGHSNNLLVATSAGVPGEARFRASAEPRPPTQINVGMGNNQIGEAGGSAPLPLTAWASDNLNGAPNVPVTFKVTSGDAKVAAKDQANATDSVVIPTDSTGHVDAYLHFGTSGGPVTVEVTFAGLQGNPAVFMARALVRQPGQPASFNAVVQDNTGLAIGGATCTLNINGIKLPPVVSDANGFFTIPDVNPGAGFVQVDGRTANKLGGQPFNQPGRFPSLVYRITIVPNADNPLPTTVYLPTLNPVNERTYDGTADVDLTIEGIAGLKMTIKAGSMTLADGTRPTAATPVTVSLNQVHADNIPMPIQDGVAPLLTWTLQPPGAHFDPPVAIQYPNMTGLRPGATTNFLSYNHDVERFEIVASGTVSADGSVIKTDPGVGLLNSGWGCNCPPYAATGECKKEDDVKVTITSPVKPVYASVDETITFTAAGTPAGGDYAWSGGEDPATGSSASFPTKFKTSGSKTVSVVYKVTTSDGEKTARDSITLQVVEITGIDILNSSATSIARGAKAPKRTDICAVVAGSPSMEFEVKTNPALDASKVPASFFHWSGGSAVSHNPLQRTAASASTKKEIISVSCGSSTQSTYSMITYAVGAVATGIRTSGASYPDNATPQSLGLHGPNSTSGTYSSGIEIEFIIKPDALVADANGKIFDTAGIQWDVSRDKQFKRWRRTGGSWSLYDDGSTAWVSDDTLGDSDEDNNPWDGKGHLYGTDAPGISNLGNTYDWWVVKLNMREWVRVGLGGTTGRAGVICSGYSYWRAFRSVRNNGSAWINDNSYDNVLTSGNDFWGSEPPSK